MSEITIEITNPDGYLICPVLLDSPGYDEYLDRPRRLVCKIEKSSGLDPQGTAKVSRKGKIILLGHVTKFDQSKPEYDSLTLDSAEYLLDQRIGSFYRFPSGTTLTAMLQKLIDLANGLVPRGSFVLHSGSVYKWVGMGTASRLGTLTTVYQNATLLTKKTAIPTVAASWYQSATDLYIWTSDGKDPSYHLIIIPYFKDTLVRLGTISLGTTTFSVCFEIGAAKLFPTIKALILAAGLEYSLRYEKDGYAYLDGSVAVGKGSSSEPVATYIEGKNAEITIDQMDGFGKLQALLGQGAGAGITQQCAAAFDTTTLGVWREGIYQAGGLFGTMLSAATVKVFADCQDPIIYNVRAIDQDWSQAVGNYVAIIRNGYQPVYKRIKHISQKPGGDMLLEVGQRLRTLQELLKSGEEVQQILSSFYGSHTKNAWSWSLPETNIDSYEAITHQFLLASTDDSVKAGDDKTIGSGEIDPNFPFMVLLNLKIGWFTSSTYSSTVPTDSHGAVGGHSGYGGGQTSAKQQDAHGVAEQEVTGATTGLFNFYAFSGNVYNTDACASNHAVASHWSLYGDWSGAPTNKLTSVSVGGVSYDTLALGSHTHVYRPASQFMNAVNAGHKHPLPAHSTQTATAQSHTEELKSAQTRAGSSAHPERDAILEGLKKKYGTGKSVHYLTLDVKVGGVRVPGSPFSGSGGTGLYIGDSLDNIDISSLVSVGVQNSISITLTEFGGPGPVKCSVSGNVNVNAVISAF
jgi:hypothetical protein